MITCRPLSTIDYNYNFHTRIDTKSKRNTMLATPHMWISAKIYNSKLGSHKFRGVAKQNKITIYINLPHFGSKRNPSKQTLKGRFSMYFQTHFFPSNFKRSWEVEFAEHKNYPLKISLYLWKHLWCFLPHKDRGF